MSNPKLQLANFQGSPNAAISEDSNLRQTVRLAVGSWPERLREVGSWSATD